MSVRKSCKVGFGTMFFVINSWSVPLSYVVSFLLHAILGQCVCNIRSTRGFLVFM